MMLPTTLHDDSAPADLACWRIELHDIDQNTIQGLDVVGDVVIGSGPDADIDLASAESATHGLAPRHALLRPTESRLFLIDLRSPGGTLVNNQPMIYGEAIPIADGMQIGLGEHRLVVRIIDHLSA